MITLAVASAFLVLASQLSWLTGGEDGRSFQLPELLRPGTVLISKNGFGFELNGHVLTYYLIFVASAAMILALLRVVNSPFGRVLQAIRENRFRAEALGFRTVFHLTYANCIAALVAAGAGMLNALWLRYAGPDTSLSFSIMLDILLMVATGGFFAGQGPESPEGPRATPLGKVGRELPLDQGYTAAKLTALSRLGYLQRTRGDLARVTHWVRIFGMVNSAPGFVQQPAVIN